MQSMLTYFAYGSNLHPLRLTERVPSARMIGSVELANHRLAFHKRSHDGSGKCNLQQTGMGTDRVFGAIYDLDPEHKPLLDRHEGVGSGYLDEPLEIVYQGQTYDCFTYRAQTSHIVDHLLPYHWYKQLVLLGARYCEFPPAYIAAIEAVSSIDDADAERSEAHDVLIQKMLGFSDDSLSK